MCQPPLFLTPDEASELYPPALSATLSSNPCPPWSQQPWKLEEGGAAAITPPPCVVIDADQTQEALNLATWDSALFPRNLFLSSPSKAASQGNPGLTAPGSTSRPGKPQLRLSSEDLSRDWADRTVPSRLWEGKEPLGSPSSSSDSDTSEGSIDTLLPWKTPSLLSQGNHQLLPLIFAVEDDAGCRGSDVAVSRSRQSHRERGSSRRVAPAELRVESGSAPQLLGCDTRVTGRTAHSTDLPMAHQHRLPVIPREQSRTSIHQSVPELGLPQRHSANGGGGRPPGYQQGREGNLEQSWLIMSPGTAKQQFSSAWQGKNCRGQAYQHMLEDSHQPHRTDAMKPRRGHHVRRRTASSVPVLPHSTDEPKHKELPGLPPSPMVGQVEASCSLPHGSSRSAHTPQASRGQRVETDTSLLEGKLKLLTLQRRMYAAKCQQFLQYLEGEEPAKGGQKAGSGIACSASTGPANGVANHKAPRVPKGSRKNPTHQEDRTCSRQSLRKHECYLPPQADEGAGSVGDPCSSASCGKMLPSNHRRTSSLPYCSF